MTVPQLLYLVSIAIYIVFFCLFVRLFFWKSYSEKTYWRRKPRLTLAQVQQLARDTDQELPYLTVMVPARNEADVIEQTIKHMTQLNYPPDRYEVVIVTDQKELMIQEAHRPRTITNTLDALSEGLHTRHAAFDADGRRLALGLLTQLSLQDLESIAATWHQLPHWHLIHRLSPSKLFELVRTIAEEILAHRGRPAISRLTCLIERAYSGLDDDQVYGALCVHLGLALPVVAALCSLEQSESSTARNMMRLVAQTHHERTYSVLYTLTCGVSNQLRSHLQSLLADGQLRPALQDAYLLSFPTTQDIVARQQADLKRRSSSHRLRHVVVPFDFDGKYQGQCVGSAVPSTKGRALNFALPLIDPRSQVCGFYDAESRPETNVLLYVAHRRLQEGESVQILQGPVFQVRNFYSLGPFTKIVSLYQAISHDWYLPVIFRRLPFVGGTNLFVATELLARIKGYDDDSLTEDLELGARAYLKCGAWPEFLPFYSSEQTPPVFRAFFRQRLRWGTGHLQVMEKIRTDTSYPRDKAMMIWRRLFVKAQVEWTLYQFGALLPPLALLLWWLGYIDPSIAPFEVRAVMNGLSLLYFAFTVYAYTRYSPYVDQSARPRDWRGRAGIYGSLVMLPFVAFFFPIPFSTALVLKGLHLEPKIWVKTPRTRE